MNETYENDDFLHGFRSGTEDIDKETYEGYLSNQVTYEYLQQKIEDKKADIAHLNERIQATQTEKKTLFGQLQQFASVADMEQRNMERIAEKRQKNNERRTAIEDRKKEHKTPYALLAGILYLLAGTAFVAGDLIISHEIVAYALNIRNSTEAWAFAIGLASLSILLKPAYERLVEQPYLTNYNAKTKRVYGYFQIALVIFAMGTMVVLGWFRYEAYKTDKLKDGINKQIQALQLDTQPIDPTQPVDNQAIIQKMDEKLQAFNDLNLSLVNSKWALLSFVLSGVLFAIAGAICLGIAFPILSSYWYRWLQASPALRRLKKDDTKLDTAYETAEKAWLEARREQQVVQHSLDLQESTDELATQRTELHKEVDDLLNKCKGVDIDRRIYTYSDGYEMGKTNRRDMSPEALAAFRNNQFRNISDAKDDAANRSPKVYRNNGLRPHQALRKAITDGFNEN